MRDNINQIFDLLDKAFFEMIENLSQDYNLADIQKARDIERKINELKENLKAEHLENVEQGSYKYEAGVIYNDIFSQCERMGDFVYYVSETIEEFNQLYASAKQK
jgi:phosphate:Na+ symporter